MVNSVGGRRGFHSDFHVVSLLVASYVVVIAATIALMALLSAVAPGLATPHAWGHMAIAAVFAALMPLRLRQAKRGSARAQRVLVIVASVLLVANVVEALTPGTFPGWMRIEMVGIAAIMAAIVVAVLRCRR